MRISDWSSDVCSSDLGRLADERQHVVFTQRIQLDVADDDHLVIGGLEHRTVDDFLDVLLVALRQKLHRLGSPMRSAQQAFAVGVLADRFDARAEVVLHCYDPSSYWGDRKSAVLG